MLRKSTAILRLAIIGVCASCAVSAWGDDYTGYLTLSGGYNIPSGKVKETDVSTDDGTALPDDQITLKNGWDASVGVGLYAAKHCRVEFQYTGQYNSLDSIKFDTVQSSADGSVYANLFMVNALYDVPLGDRFSIYLGGGIGALYSTWDASYSANEFSPPVKAVDNNNGWGFAYQAMVGVAYEVMPNLYLTAGYRGWSSTNVSTQFSTMEFPWMNIIEAGLRISF